MAATPASAAASSGLSAGRPATAPPPLLRSGAAPRRYGFNCVYCSSRLEATEAQGGTEGTCPTCGSQITIPILDRYGRLIDPRTNQVIKPDPHPVHAYAAAGERAPKLRRRPDGSHEIICPRCASPSPVSANNCKGCGNPFTMEGTTAGDPSEGSGLATASLVLGIVSLPAFCLIVIGPLAVAFGCIALYQGKDQANSGKGLAIAGVITGGIGSLFSIAWFFS
jgi:DNA-directed RNA polymerase subunit RPC12/RpoP